MIGIAVVKIVPFQHPGHRTLGRKLDDVRKGHLAKPLAVIINFRPASVNDLEDLLHVGVGVFLHILPGQLFPGL